MWLGPSSAVVDSEACSSVSGTIFAASAIACWFSSTKSMNALTCGFSSAASDGYMNSGRESGV